MPAKKYIVKLESEEREGLLELTSKGQLSARKMKRAQILLKADEGWKDKEIMAALNTSRTTVERTRKRFVEGGLDRALNEDPRPGQRAKLDGKAGAHLIAALYDTFEAAEANRIRKGLEFHYTPKHGSWLNRPRSSSAFSHAKLGADTSPMNRRSNTTCKCWRWNAIANRLRLTGISRLKTPARNCTAFIHLFQLDRVVV